MRSLFIITLFLLRGVALAADPCACPVKDRLQLTECGPKPFAMNHWVARVEGCKANPYSPTALLENFRGLPDALSTEKSKLEFLDYLSCYRLSDEQFCHYKNTLAPYIEYAAKVAGLSPVVEACMFLQESSFLKNPPNQPKNLNDTTYGYVQMNQVTLNEINELIQPKAAKSFLREMAFSKNEIDKIQGKKERTQKDLDLLRIQKNIYFVNSNKLKTRAVWNRYWNGGKAPEKIGIESTKCPSVAFGMAMMERISEMQQLMGDERYPDKNVLNGFRKMNAIDAEIFSMGAYNLGVNGFKKFCAQSETLQECIDALRRANAEVTLKHLISIRNCVYRNSFEPGNYDPKKSNCSAMKCDR